MKINELIKTDLNIEINKIKTNSKNIQPGDLFVCIKGANFDRHDFIDEARKNGAVCAIVSKDVSTSLPTIKVEDPDKTLIDILKKYYDNPQKKLKLIGITGTDGKTTTCKIIQQLIGEDLCGYIGTLGADCKDYFLKTSNTTPPVETMYQILAEFVKRGIKYVAMETSSEAFYYHRLDSFNFDIGGLTNITSDHMNTHKTLENYINCKKQLFIHSKMQILNQSDNHYKEIVSISKKPFTYGYENNHLTIKDYTLKANGTDITYQYNGMDYSCSSSLLGKFNIENLSLALLCCLKANIDIKELLNKCSKLSIPGRMQVIDLGQKYHVVIDYAHTVNAVDTVLDFANTLEVNRIITVTGQAGGRDHSKRKFIGKSCLDKSDLVILTTDDPRFENVDDIIKDILELSTKTNYKIIKDRPKAIQHACSIAKENDLILLLGKGSDKYQAVEDRREYYFEEEEAIKAIKMSL